MIFNACILSVNITFAQTLNWRYYYNNVLEFAIQGKFLEAKEQYEIAIRHTPYIEALKDNLEAIDDALSNKINEQTAIYFFKGIYYYNQNKNESAIVNFNKSIELDP